MARLIDADYLKESLYKHGYSASADMIDLMSEINNCPTAYAIPVSWIREYERVFPSDDIEDMIESWEIENEID